MRILYLHQYFVTPCMSGGSRSYEMARALVRAGHDVQVLTTWRDPGKHKSRGWFSEHVDGFQVHWLPVAYSNQMNFFRRLCAFFEFAYKAGRHAAQLGGDLVFGTSTPLTIAIPAVHASRKLGVPMVFEVRDLWPELPIAMGVLKHPLLIAMAKRLERYAYKNARHVVALSPGMADGVVRTGYSSANVTVIPNMSNIQMFGAAADEAEEFLRKHPRFCGRKLIVYAGAIGEANGVDYLVRMASKMRELDPGIGFLIVGEGKHRLAVEQLAREIGVLDNNLWIIDSIPKVEMPGLLGAAAMACSLFINLPEMSNMSPNKFFDAIASGTPVVVNCQGWIADLVTDRGVGVVTPPDQPEEAAQRVAEFLSDSARVETAGQNAVALAKESFDKDLLASRLVEVLESSVDD